MSLNQPETQALGSIGTAWPLLTPRLASMLTIFSRLAAGEDMPVREKTRVRRWRPAAHRPRRARRYPRRAQPSRNRAACTRGWAGNKPCWCWGPSSPPHCSPPRWALTASGPKTCARSMRPACPSPSITRVPAQANADAPRAISTSMNAKGAGRA